ncbi:hypothetical protein BG015_006386 [Linnemannia schmuckeri]|uniref:Uncharacterized protein n=1 Tax=Linnemannia schmuckeri TaxID=64567 RepID=A0A9P5RZR9_9FUNG|nr:hypothetical protein BG015_006386 [Linnemannia schmuckeri]
MKLATAIFALACALTTQAAPITLVSEPVAASSPQNLSPRDMGWQSAPSEPAQDVNENNPWDKRDMGWQSIPSTPQEVQNDPWDKRNLDWQDAPPSEPAQGVKNNNPWDKRDMGWQAVPSNPQEVKNNPWDVVKPDTNPWDKRGNDSV